MRISQVLAVFGGIFGILGGIFAIVVGFIAEVFEEAFGKDSTTYFFYVGGIIAIFASIVVIAASFMRNKTVAGIIILSCAIVGLICISIGYIISFPLFLVSSIIFFIEGKKDRVKLSEEKKIGDEQQLSKMS